MSYILSGLRRFVDVIFYPPCNFLRPLIGNATPHGKWSESIPCTDALAPVLLLRTGSARVPQVNKPHESGVGRKHKSSDGQQQLAAGAEAAVSRQGHHPVGAVGIMEVWAPSWPRLLTQALNSPSHWQEPLQVLHDTWSTSKGGYCSRCPSPSTSWRCRRVRARPPSCQPASRSAAPGQVGVGGCALVRLVLAVLRGRERQ